MLNERHKADCTCSYCHDAINGYRLHFGLNIPPKWWGWNSWYVIKYAPGRYLRFTPLTLLRRFQVRQA